MDNKEFAGEFNRYQEMMEEKTLEYSRIISDYEQQVNMLSSIIEMYKYLNRVHMSDTIYDILCDTLIGIMGVSKCTVAIESNRSLIIRASTDKQVGSILDTVINDECSMIEYITKDTTVIGAIEITASLEQIRSKNTQQFLKLICSQLVLILDNRQLNKQIILQANTDLLTGCYNRRAFYNKIKSDNVCATDYCIFMFDIDFFKKVNDTYGHEAGDVILREVGNILITNVRHDDIVCRYGGEEFIICLCGIKSHDIAYRKAEQIREVIENTVIKYGNTDINVTASVGICLKDTDVSTIEEVIKVADTKLYESKHNGRNRVTM